MKNLFNLTISLVFILVKHQPIIYVKVRLSNGLLTLKALFASNIFCLKYFDSIQRFGKNAVILGKCIVRKERFKNLMIEIGNHAVIHDGTEFRGRGEIKIGPGASIGYGNIFCCTSKIYIGENVLLADNVKFYTANHQYSNQYLPIKEQGEDQGEIIIEDGAWIGANVVLLKNAHVKKGAIIGSNAVVTGVVPENEIWGGVPARKIKNRF